MKHRRQIFYISFFRREIQYEVKNNFGSTSKYPNYYTYSIVDKDDNLIYKNGSNVSKSLNDAYKNRDTIINIEVNGKVSSLLELGTAFNLELTGIENIYQHGQVMGLTNKQIKENIVRYPLIL